MIKDEIAFSDSSLSMVQDRTGGVLLSFPAAEVLGFHCISGISGFDSENFSYRHRFQDLWTITATISGKGQVNIMGRDFHAVPGTIYVIPPGMYFHEKNTNNCLWGFACLLLHFKDGIFSLPFKKGKAFHLSGCFSILSKIKETVRMLHYRPSGFEIQVLGETLSLIGLIQERSSGSNTKPISETMLKASKIITRDLTKPTDISSLAEECCVSNSLLAHRFKKEFGYSPMKFARKERIRAAKELLLCGHSIGETASHLGFKSQFHLSRLFSKIEGISPSDFKKMYERH